MGRLVLVFLLCLLSGVGLALWGVCDVGHIGILSVRLSLYTLPGIATSGALRAPVKVWAVWAYANLGRLRKGIYAGQSGV